MNKKILLLILTGLVLLSLVVGVVIHVRNNSSSSSTPASSSCQPPCVLGFSCVDGSCVQGNSPSSSCQPPCKPGFSCVNNTCVQNTPSRPYFSSCPPPCATGFSCMNNTCIQTSPLSLCQPPCSAGYTCKNGKCAPTSPQGVNNGGIAQTCAIMSTLTNQCSNPLYCIAGIGDAPYSNCKAGDSNCFCPYCCPTSDGKTTTMFYDCSSQTTPPTCPTTACNLTFPFTEGQRYDINWLIPLPPIDDPQNLGYLENQCVYVTKFADAVKHNNYFYGLSELDFPSPNVVGYLIPFSKVLYYDSNVFFSVSKSGSGFSVDVWEIDNKSITGHFENFSAINSYQLMSKPSSQGVNIIIGCPLGPLVL